MSRAEDFTPGQKREIFMRANGRCEKCGRKLGIAGEKWDAHHKTGIWDGGKADLQNGQALCKVPCHQEETREQAGQRAEAYRHQKQRAGIKSNRKWKRSLPGSRDSEWKIPLNGPPIRRRGR